MTAQRQPDTYEELAARHGTPLYVYRASVIRRQALRLQKAFPDFALLYSMKCNPLPGICRLLAGLGFGFDCCSGKEVLAACANDKPYNRIVYSAPGKTRQEISSSLGKSLVFADSWSELELINSICAERGTVLDAGLRVSPAISLGQGTRPAILNAVPDKFGVPEEDLPARARWLASLKNIRLTGLHVYMRSQVLDAETLSSVFSHTAAIVRLLHTEPGFQLRYINFGGGFGIPYQAEEELSLEDTGRTCSALAKDLLKLCPGVQLFLESGRYLVGQAGSFVSRILDVKECRGTTFVIAEGLLNHFFRPALARLMDDFTEDMPAAAKGPCEPLWGGPGILLPKVYGTPAPARPVTLCGTLCTAQDCVARDIVLPDIVPGNLLVFPNAGAYSAVLSPHDFGFQKECRQVLIV